MNPSPGIDGASPAALAFTLQQGVSTGALSRRLLSCMDVVHLHDGMKDENCPLEGLGVGDTLVYLNRTEP